LAGLIDAVDAEELLIGDVDAVAADNPRAEVRLLAKTASSDAMLMSASSTYWLGTVGGLDRSRGHST